MRAGWHGFQVEGRRRINKVLSVYDFPDGCLVGFDMYI